MNVQFSGPSADRVLVHADTGVHPDLLNSRFGYVSISRASHQAIVFTDDIARFHSHPAADVSKTWKLVACCIERNKIKGDWDPATDAEGNRNLR